MTIEVVGIFVLWLFLFGYVFIGAVEFGAGFYNAYGKMTGKDKLLEHVIQRYLSPVWEVTNVFLVFFFVGLVGFFPDTAYYYGTTLLVPVSIALVLLSIRGAYYAFSIYGRGTPDFTYLYGWTGILLPASLSIVFAIAAGGFVTIGGTGPVLEFGRLFTSPFAWSIVLLSVFSVLYISAVFLTWYASYAKDREAEPLLRKYALIFAWPAFLAGAAVFMAMNGQNSEIFAGLQSVWWLFLLSGLSFLGAFLFLWKKRQSGVSLLLVFLQYISAFFAYGMAHFPYLLYPYVTVYDGFTNRAMAVALITAFILGLLVLIPSLYLLLRLFLFDKQYVTGKRLNHA